MSALITRRRLARLSGVASAQIGVQIIGFASGMLLVRHMDPAQYGYYTLALSLGSVATILADLGLGSAVLALGGQHGVVRSALAALLADAAVLRRRLALLPLLLLVPCSAGLLLHQNAAPTQVALLTLLVLGASALNVGNGISLSISRLLGHVAYQQKLDLASNVAKLIVLLLLSWVTLDATLACAVNLGVSIAYAVAFRAHLDAHVGSVPAPTGRHRAALREQVRQQAPNSLYFVLSSQVGVWLIGVFGSASQVAEVGALGRLAVLFTVLGAVCAALVLPYFARRHSPTELASGFAGVNGFFAALLVGLVGLAQTFPSEMLWVLGGHYGDLHSELVWMVAAATLSAWGGTIYGMGCSRGWVTPFGLGTTAGLVATAVAASLVDVSTVRGCFIVSTATSAAGALACAAYVGRRLRRHRTAAPIAHAALS